MCYDVCEKRKDVFIWEKRKDIFICETRDSEHLRKKIVTIVVCCLSCVKFLVNLFDVAGMKERIFIDCHWEYLGFNYSNSCNDFCFHSDSDDTDFSDNDQENKDYKSTSTFILFHRIKTLQL